MLLSATIITILYVHVALVLIGVLTVDGGTWRLKAPTRKTNIRDFFAQFSWGRLHRPFGHAADHSIAIQDHLEAGSSDVSEGSLDHGRRNKSKSVSKKPSTAELSVYEASSRPMRLKKLAIKMLWYPSGRCDISHHGSRSEEPFAVYLLLILPMAITRISPSVDLSLNVVLGFTCMLLLMVRHNSRCFTEYT
jgi:hypothetical protein